jgi:hypothetical protein
MLNELDIKILIVIYELKYNYSHQLDFKELGFENNQYAASHLLKLRTFRFIDFDDNEVFNKLEKDLTICSENIDLLVKGYEEVKKHLL